jgi:cob(I)alamin adenosyltransferase
MSISTTRGDRGETDLLFGRRVFKSHPRVEAVGAVDELNAAVGLVRAAPAPPLALTAEVLTEVQDDLVSLMGEVSTLPEDQDRYDEAGYARLGEDAVERMSEAVSHLENQFATRFKDWAKPGAERNLVSAQLDFARTVCRRAERAVLRLKDTHSEVALRYLNRLSDVLWLLARHEDAETSRTCAVDGEGGGRRVGDATGQG